MKWNESGFRQPLCTYRLIGPGEPPEDGEMTLSSRHRIRNSSPGGLRPSTLPLGHGGSPQYWLSHVDGEETIFGNRTPNSGMKGSGANHYPRVLALLLRGKKWHKIRLETMYSEHSRKKWDVVSGRPHSRLLFSMIFISNKCYRNSLHLIRKRANFMLNCRFPR